MLELLEYGSEEEILLAPNFIAVATAAYADASDLVQRIGFGEAAAVEELDQFFSKAIRFYFVKNFGDGDLDYAVRETLIAVTQTIQRGEFNEPSHLIGLVRKIARQQATARLKPLSSDGRFAPANNREGKSAESGASRQRLDLIVQALRQLESTDREILTRLYLEEQSQYQICSDMSLTETQFRLFRSRALSRFRDAIRKQQGEWVAPDEPRAIKVSALDLSRIIPVVAHAVAVFGDEGKASHWLMTRLQVLGYHSPSEVLESADGADRVDQILTRIEHNIPS